MRVALAQRDALHRSATSAIDKTLVVPFRIGQSMERVVSTHLRDLARSFHSANSIEVLRLQMAALADGPAVAEPRYSAGLRPYAELPIIQK